MRRLIVATAIVTAIFVALLFLTGEVRLPTPMVWPSNRAP